MTPEEFVRIVEIQVSESSTAAARELIERPPGRRPDPASIELSRWFNALPDHEKSHVDDTIKLSVDIAVFTFLNLLDGTKTINPYSGALVLSYDDEGKEVVLNDGPTFLYELYRTSAKRIADY